MIRREWILALVLMAFGSSLPISLWARPKVGLALSGGGARGLAHVGVLKALEQMQIPIDAVAGTSVGAIVGSMYAAGYSAAEIESIAREADWNVLIFDDRVPRRSKPLRRKRDHERYVFDFELGLNWTSAQLPTGLIHGHRLGFLLGKLLTPVSAIKDFDRLPIPFRTMAIDLEKGTPVVLKQGEIVEAVQASAAYPGVFSPVEINGRMLVDGGAVNNMPVDVLKAMGMDIVIAVDLNSVFPTREKLNSFVEITNQIITVGIQSSVEKQLKMADIVIQPDSLVADTFEFKDFEKTLASGATATWAAEKNLKRLSVESSDYRQWRSQLLAKQKRPRVLGKIRVDGFRRVDPRTITSRLSLKEGSPVKMETIEEEVDHIFSLGDFEKVRFSFDGAGDKTDLQIRAVEKSWGPTYVRFAATWDGEIQGKQDGNALMNIKSTRINALNAESTTDLQVGTILSLDSEFYQPLTYSGLAFVAPQLSVWRQDEDIYQNENRVAEYEVDSVSGGMDIGLNVLDGWELRAGLRRGYLNSEVSLGDPTIPTFSNHTGSWVAQTTIDYLDSVYFPRSGVFLNSDLVSSHQKLGADEAYRKFSFQTHFFASHSRFTGFVSVLGGASLASTLPFYDQFRVGGFRNLSGFREEELRGQHFGVGRVGMLWKTPLQKSIFWNQVFLGAWAEAGNAWDRREDMDFDHLEKSGTLAAGMETKIGALWLAYGHAGQDHQQFYISAGRSFGIRESKFY